MTKKAMKILVVDDQPTIRAIVKSQLRHMGYQQISEASDGASAFEILKKSRISLVISDWNMPQMNGYELLKAVRGDKDLTGTPFIMVSGDARPNDIHMAVQLKVDQFILKPFTMKVLEEKICQVVQ